MFQHSSEFRNALRIVLEKEEGVSIESEGTVYVRSLEGGLIVAGLLDDEGAIAVEHEFQRDVMAAVDFFCRERDARNHGARDDT